MNLTRRAALGTTVAALAVPGLAQAQSKRLDILSRRVHQQVLTQGAAGDLTAGWRRASNAELSWATADIGPLQDRLLREASLPSSDFGVGYLLNSRTTPDVARLLEPLEGLLQDQPIDRFEDIAPGLRQAMVVNGRTIAVPVRHATDGLFYNRAMLEQRGIAAPSCSLEEFLEQARQLTFRPSGAATVTGLVMTAALAAYPVMFARAFGGDFVTPDYKVIPDLDAMTKAIAAIRGLFEAGALPRSYATTSNKDQVT
jgi:multiple sugar transport system substrate-binding protein